MAPAQDIGGVPASLTRYLRAWNSRDPESRRDHKVASVTEEIRFTDPANDHIGRDALAANMAEFRATHPNADLARGSNVDGHNRRYRYEWTIVTGGALLLRGFDLTTLDDKGLIASVYGFFEPLVRIGPEA